MMLLSRRRFAANTIFDGLACRKIHRGVGHDVDRYPRISKFGDRLCLDLRPVGQRVERNGHERRAEIGGNQMRLAIKRREGHCADRSARFDLVVRGVIHLNRRDLALLAEWIRDDPQ